MNMNSAGAIAFALIAASTVAFADEDESCGVVPLDEGARCWREDFNSYSNLVSKLKSPFAWRGSYLWRTGWQAYVGTEEPEKVGYNEGTTQYGSFNIWYDRERYAEAWSFGAYSSQQTNRIYGVVFSNATDRAITGFGFAFTARQYGARNALVDVLDCEWCVSPEVSILADDVWHRFARFESPVLHGDDAALPVERRYSGLLATKLPPGGLLKIRWVDSCPKTGSNAAMGIDDLSLSYALASGGFKVFVR